MVPEKAVPTRFQLPVDIALRDEAETLRRDLVAEIGCAVRMTYGDQLDRPIEVEIDGDELPALNVRPGLGQQTVDPIGQVVAELRRAYPDVTHSSLRFLEREGKAQESWGESKDKARDALDKGKDAVDEFPEDSMHGDN